jgi:hypothetical protein
MTNRDLANATGLAAWIVANGYRTHMSRNMVLRLVRTDPRAPKPVPSAAPRRSTRCRSGAATSTPPPILARPASISAPKLTRTWWTQTRWRDAWSRTGTHRP